MESEILFTESQKFEQPWIWIILLGVNGLLIFAIIKLVFDGQQFGNNSLNNFVLITAFVITMSLTVLIFSLRLDTHLRKDGVYVQFFPFHQTFRYFPWDKIEKSYIRQYNPITEYGGWGLRTGLFGKGKAFNVSGNKGLQLEFTNKEKLLIGTNKPAELNEALDKIGQLGKDTNR